MAGPALSWMTERAFSDPAAEPHEDQRMQTGTPTSEVRDDFDIARRSHVAMTLMEELQSKERIMVVLRYGEQLEISEIASVMHCTEQHVFDTLSGVEGRMRELLQQHDFAVHSEVAG